MTPGSEEARGFTGFPDWHRACSVWEQHAQHGHLVLRLTLLTSAVASGTFVATLIFAPSAINFGQREIARVSAPPAATPKERDCRSPLDKIIAALQYAPCP